MREAPVPVLLRGAYRLERKIGQGGMGLVYRAEDLALARTVAVKTLLRADSDLAARLRHEARAMASVAHPNLATVFGAETWKGRPLILVEYFNAGTLEDRLEKGPLPIPEAIQLGVRLSGGIEHLHELGMLHRDIKPSNIGFSVHRQPKLLDFGLVQFLSDREDSLPDESEPVEGVPPAEPDPASILRDLEITRPGRVRGTLPYLSPEVLSGERPGAQSDVWSLAVVLFEAVAGVNPFLRPGGAARNPAPDLRTYRPGSPPEVAEFFDRALSPDPDERPRTIRSLRLELESLPARVT